MATPFTVLFNGAEIRGEADGFGLPVVFLHAGVTDRRLWADQMKAVSDAGFHAISYDRRGFGETTAPDEPFDHLADLEEVLDQLGIHAAILVGCSMGGGLAIDFALDNPERTVGLVLVGTAVTGATVGEVPEELDPMIEALETAEEEEDWDTVNKIEAHAWLDGPLSKNGRVQGHARDLFFAMNASILGRPKLTQEEEREPAVDMLDSLTAPTLLVVGDLDFPHIIERHAGLSEEIENVFAVVLEGTAHLPSLERPDLFNPLLLEFLQAVAGEADLGDDDEDEEDDED